MQLLLSMIGLEKMESLGLMISSVRFVQIIIASTSTTDYTVHHLAVHSQPRFIKSLSNSDRIHPYQGWVREWPRNTGVNEV